jgi:hypothetical protein
MSYIRTIKNKEIMRFWHTVFDSEGIVREQFLSTNSKRVFSLECSAKSWKGTYEVIPQPETN